MKEVTGIYASAKIWTDDVEDYAAVQIAMICDQPAAAGSQIRVMPDVHPGKVGPIGLTMTVGEKILPQLLGVDIGCGVLCAVLKEKHLEYQKLEKVIRQKIPSGFAVREVEHHMADTIDLHRLHCFRHIREEKAKLALGTLGGGNHFIEVDQAQNGQLYLVIHSGSRSLGKEVAEHYTMEGARQLKARGIEVPYPMTWLEGTLMEEYVQDLQVVQEYASLNRQIMALDENIAGMK